MCWCQEECDTDNRTEREESINILALAPILAVPIPESCGDFVPANLVQCLPELNVIEGCCVSSCRNLVAQYTPTCYQELAAAICLTDSASGVEILDAVSSRCYDDYQPLSCAGNATSIPDSSPSPVLPPIPEQTEELIPLVSETIVEDEDAVEPSLPDPDMDELEELEEGSMRNLLSVDPFEIEDEACLENRVTDPNVETAQFLPLLSELTLPESCGNYTPVDLLPCREELEIYKGCCNSACTTSFTMIPHQCLEDVGTILCRDYTDLLLPLSRVVLRCNSRFETPLCDRVKLEIMMDEDGLATLTTDEESTQDNNGVGEFHVITKAFSIIIIGLVFWLI
eukprot:g4791.t1